MRVMSLRLAVTALGIAGLAQSVSAENSVAVPSFVEETASAGIDSVYAGEWEYMVGGGAATFDCNGDGFADMLLAGGTAPAKFYRNASSRGGALKFEAEASGLELEAVTGVYPLDVDSDGNTDLVLRAIEDALADNLRLEDEIDQEVEQLLAQNVNEIRAMEMDVGALRAKMKRELARKKRFVL